MTPASSIERLLGFHADLESAASDARVEVYHRATERIRVTHRAGSRRCFRSSGLEEGVAVRWVDSEGRESFGASSGGGADAITWASVAVRSGTAISIAPPGLLPWLATGGPPLLDPEPEPLLPTGRELEGWLDLAIENLRETSRSIPRAAVAEAWIEAGFTSETLVGHGGLAAFRSRSRVWAFLHKGGNGCPGTPTGIAARRLASLAADSWGRAAGSPGGVVPPKLDDARALVFEGEAAGRIVAAIAWALHRPGAPTGLAVGPGWQVADDPLDPEGLGGGRFDDAGFPTAAMTLADGVRAVGSLGSAGHLRRASFRDPPEPAFSTIVVRSAEVRVPDDAVRVRDLRIHRLAPTLWILEAGRLGFLEVSPTDLARTCLGTTGPVHRSPAGVLTRGLVFASQDP